jgi:hypothetical protein
VLFQRYIGRLKDPPEKTIYIEETQPLIPGVFVHRLSILCFNDMIPGSKGRKSDASLLAGGFLNLGPAKNMSKEPFFEEK